MNALGLPDTPRKLLADLGEDLDAAYRELADRLGDDTPASVDEDGELHVAALAALLDPPSLIDLRRRVAAMMPRVDLPEMVRPGPRNLPRPQGRDHPWLAAANRAPDRLAAPARRSPPARPAARPSRPCSRSDPTPAAATGSVRSRSSPAGPAPPARACRRSCSSSGSGAAFPLWTAAPRVPSSSSPSAGRTTRARRRPPWRVT